MTIETNDRPAANKLPLAKQMNAPAVRWVMEMTIFKAPLTKLVLLDIAYHTTAYNWSCWLDPRDIAKRCGCKLSALGSQLFALRDFYGLLQFGKEVDDDGNIRPEAWFKVNRPRASA